MKPSLPLTLSVLFLLALPLIATSIAHARTAQDDPSYVAPVAPRASPYLVCATVDGPLPEHGPPTVTCDQVCARHDHDVCVASDATTNPRNCETPTIRQCRCCHMEQ